MRLKAYDFVHNKTHDFESALDAVHYMADKAERGCDDTHDRLRYRTEALANMLGRLLDTLPLTPEQVMAVFDHDVIAE